MRKVKIITDPVANRYTGADGERIIEFSHPQGGGLISFRPTDSGQLITDVYRTDPTVEVRTPGTTGSGSLYAGVVGTATLTETQAATVRHWLHKAMRRIADNGTDPVDITPAELRQTAARMITTELEIFTHSTTDYDHLQRLLQLLDD